jgi:hypothetical protein
MGALQVCELPTLTRPRAIAGLELPDGGTVEIGGGGQNQDISCWTNRPVRPRVNVNTCYQKSQINVVD